MEIRYVMAVILVLTAATMPARSESINPLIKPKSWVILQSNVWACQEASDIKKLYELADAEDHNATLLLVAQKCVDANKGMRIWISEIDYDSAAMKIRLPGSLTEIWLPIFVNVTPAP